MRCSRRLIVLLLLLVAALPLLAQPRPNPTGKPGPGDRPLGPPPGGGPDGGPNGGPNGPRPRCCQIDIFDAKGKKFGEVIRWDDRFPSVPLQAIARYTLPDGTSTAVVVSPEAIGGLSQLGGSAVLFASNDCSDNDAFVTQITPPLMKRYSVVLPVGNPSTLFAGGATEAWLFVTDPLPSRVLPGPIVFHSQWGDQGACVPYPPPFFTFTGTFGGYWMHRVEDLYKKFKRPFWTQ